MQMKLLNVALATALTAVLTGCGSSDGDATYNKQTVAPVDVGSGTSSTELERLKSELADAKAKGTATEEKLKELEELIAKLSGNNDKDDKGDGGDKKEGDKKEGDKKEGDTDGAGTDTAIAVTPVVKDPEHDAGLAGTTEDIKAVDATVLQNYVRGDVAVFDNVFNPDSKNTGNATVVGSEPIDNKVLSNIILARPEVNRTVRQVYAGENPHDASIYSFATTGREGELNLINGGEESLQNNNISIVTYNENDVNPTAGSTSSYTDKGEGLVAGTNGFIFTRKARNKLDEIGSAVNNDRIAITPYVLQRTYIGKSLDDSLHGIYNKAVDTKMNLKGSSMVDGGLKTKLETLSADAYKNGLVRTFSIGQVNGSKTGEHLHNTELSKDRATFIVRGQEKEEVFLKAKTKKPVIIHETGAKYITDNSDNKINSNNEINNTRIFGTLSQNLNGSIYKDTAKGSVGDIPSHVWDPAAGEDKNGAFVPNVSKNGLRDYYEESKVKYSLSEGTPNSYQFTASNANKARNDIIDIYNENQGVFKTEHTNTSAAANDDKNANGKGNGLDNALFRAGLTPKPIHLDYVQYGRVSVKADKNTIKNLNDDLGKGAEIVDIEFVGDNNGNKFTYDPTKTLSSAVNKNSNLDTYFARGLQETKDMPEKGEVTYLGHALTYGLDNSYHGDDKYISNSIVGTQREGIGNFVRAKADFAKGTVEGNIYNVWTRVGGNNNENLRTNVEEDNLVGFKGDITANHNSVLGESWLEYGDNAKGSFKGAFFGKGASELAGSVNSVKKGYDKAEWGGVFGAKALEGKEDKVFITSNIENDGTEKP